MRENCLYGSEGGGDRATGPSYPYQVLQRLLDPGFRRGDGNNFYAALLISTVLP
jgi:hypothetical protein